MAYSNIICDHRPLETEVNCVRFTIGGDVLDYTGGVSSPAASLLKEKLLINSVILDSHLGAKVMSLDIRDYFLQYFLDNPEYLRIHSKYVINGIQKKYNLTSFIASDIYVYCKIKKEMYGLKKVVCLAREQLIKNLKPYEYFPSPILPNISLHQSKPTKFWLCWRLWIEVFSEADANHLMDSLLTAYSITIDKTDSDLCGLHLDWNYKDGWVDISMPQNVIQT